jgi:hypothetical protein
MSSRGILSEQVIMESEMTFKDGLKLGAGILAVQFLYGASLYVLRLAMFMVMGR